MSGQGGEAADGGRLRHLAFFYRDQAEWRTRILDFATAGLACGEPTFIAVPGDGARLRGGRLTAVSENLHLRDMAEFGG